MQFTATYEGDRWVAGDPSRFGGRIVNYDRDGNYTETYTINSRGDTTGIATCKRENGEMVEETHMNTYNQTTTRTILERVSGDQVNFEVWREDQMLYEGANYFDGKGRVLRQVQVGGEREITIHHIYEKDLLVEHYQEEVTGERTATQLYDYDDFDDQGNWTVRLVYLGTEKIKPELVITRELEYY